MQVILNQNVDTLGSVGQVVQVKDGYARNFLLPRGLAVLATPSSIKSLERMKAKEIAKEKESRTGAEALAQKITSLTCTIEANAGEDDKLFGSVSNAEIAEALTALGIAVERKDVLVKQPIRKLGTYQVDVKCYLNMKAPLKVVVVRRK